MATATYDHYDNNKNDERNQHRAPAVQALPENTFAEETFLPQSTHVVSAIKSLLSSQSLCGRERSYSCTYEPSRICARTCTAVGESVLFAAAAVYGE